MDCPQSHNHLISLIHTIIFHVIFHVDQSSPATGSDPMSIKNGKTKHQENVIDHQKCGTASVKHHHCPSLVVRSWQPFFYASRPPATYSNYLTSCSTSISLFCFCFSLRNYSSVSAFIYTLSIHVYFRALFASDVLFLFFRNYSNSSTCQNIKHENKNRTFFKFRNGLLFNKEINKLLYCAICTVQCLTYRT